MSFSHEIKPFQDKRILLSPINIRSLSLPAPVVNVDMRYSIFDSARGELGEHVRDSVLPYQGSDGYLKYAPVDTPAFEDGALLTTPGYTQSCLHNRDFSDAVWAQGGTPGLSQNAIGIDGIANKAWTITDDSVTSTERVFQDFTGQATDAENTSIFFVGKDNDETRFPMVGPAFLNGGTTITSFWHVNTKTGDIAAEGGAQSGSSTCESYNSDFWKVTVTLQNNSTGNDTFRLFQQPARTTDFGGAAENSATGSAVFDMPCIFENSPFPFNPIESGATAAVVATESGYPRWTLPADVFDAQGTAVIWERPKYPSTDTPPPAISGILTSWDNVSSLIYQGAASAGLFVTNDGTNLGSYSATWSADTLLKLVIKWGYEVASVAKFRIGVDTGSGIVWGTETNFDGSFTLGTHLRIGYNLFGPMKTKWLQVYDQVLSDQQINGIRIP